MQSSSILFFISRAFFKVISPEVGAFSRAFDKCSRPFFDICLQRKVYFGWRGISYFSENFSASSKIGKGYGRFNASESSSGFFSKIGYEIFDTYDVYFHLRSFSTKKIDTSNPKQTDIMFGTIGVAYSS